MGEVKEGLALENGGKMTLADAMIAIILTSACPTRSPRKKHEKMRDAHYKEVTSSDRQVRVMDAASAQSAATRPVRDTRRMPTAGNKRWKTAIRLA